MVMLILFSIPMLILSSSVDAFSEKIVRPNLPEVPGQYCDRICDKYPVRTKIIRIRTEFAIQLQYQEYWADQDLSYMKFQ